MIQGKFGAEDELIFEIELITSDGLELEIEAIFDTGFSDWLAIDEQDLEGFDWDFVGEQNMLLALGEVKFDIYSGKVRIDQQTFDIPVHVGQGVPFVLLGRQ